MTHLMMMQLNYPSTSVAFFNILFGFVTFDPIPTDGIYGPLFGFNSEAFSKQTDAIGYGSIQMIENLGSVPLIMLAILLVQLISLCITSVLSTGRLYRFARFK